MSSPTMHSLKLMRERGYLAGVVERWIPQARKRIDLFGIADILCVGEDVVVVQTTSYTNIAAHVRKITEAPELPILRKAGIGVLVHGWRKRCGHWIVREVDLS